MIPDGWILTDTTYSYDGATDSLNRCPFCNELFGWDTGTGQLMLLCEDCDVLAEPDGRGRVWRKG